MTKQEKIFFLKNQKKIFENKIKKRILENQEKILKFNFYDFKILPKLNFLTLFNFLKDDNLKIKLLLEIIATHKDVLEAIIVAKNSFFVGVIPKWTILYRARDIENYDKKCRKCKNWLWAPSSDDNRFSDSTMTALYLNNVPEGCLYELNAKKESSYMIATYEVKKDIIALDLTKEIKIPEVVQLKSFLCFLYKFLQFYSLMPNFNKLDKRDQKKIIRRMKFPSSFLETFTSRQYSAFAHSQFYKEKDYYETVRFLVYDIFLNGFGTPIIYPSSICIESLHPGQKIITKNYCFTYYKMEEPPQIFKENLYLSNITPVESIFDFYNLKRKIIESFSRCKVERKKKTS